MSTGTTTDYAGNYVYENGNLQFFNQPEGYVEPVSASSTTFVYVYQYKDHLGNIRLSYKDISLTSTPSLQLVEENNYYPFGLKHKGYNANINGTHHKYMFGGKEYDESFQTLNTYDFGARNYDPALGRWMNVDPLAEQMRRHSPYNYAFDNPIFFIDPDGRAPRVPKPPFGGNPLYTITGGFQQLAQETGRLIDKAGAKLQTFFSFGGETTGNSNNLTGSISNETITEA